MVALPFSNLSFFAGAFALIAALYFLRDRLERRLSYRSLLCLISVVYATLALGAQAYKLGAVVCYMYLVYLAFVTAGKRRGRLLAIGLMILPLALVKLYIAPDLIWFVGLSYMTFRAIQLLFETGPVGFGDYLTFQLFPPALLAGPIDRWSRFTKDLDGGYAGMNRAALLAGWRQLALGLLQKFVLAELVDRFCLARVDATSHEWRQMAANMYGFTLFFYFDFAGYSNMAIGLARMIGVKLPENFNMPFLARNPRDYWQRLHITLGSWLKDYVFLPIYMWTQKHKFLREHKLAAQNLGLWITFQSVGLWNGVRPSYVLMGALYATYSVAHNSYLHYSRVRDWKGMTFLPERIRSAGAIFLMFNASALALYLFSGRFPGVDFLDRDFSNRVALVFSHDGEVSGRAPFVRLETVQSVNSEGDDRVVGLSEVRVTADEPGDLVLIRATPGDPWRPAGPERLAALATMGGNVQLALRRHYVVQPFLDLGSDSRLLFKADGYGYVQQARAELASAVTLEPEFRKENSKWGLTVHVRGALIERLDLAWWDPKTNRYRPLDLSPYADQLAHGTAHVQIDGTLPTGQNRFRVRVYQANFINVRSNLRGNFADVEKAVVVPDTLM